MSLIYFRVGDVFVFLKGKDDRTNQNIIHIPCSCGCHSIDISYFDDDTEEIFLSFFVDSFYAQDGILKIICKRIKKAFLILLGKSYKYESIVLSKNDLKILEQEINNILQKSKEEE